MGIASAPFELLLIEDDPADVRLTQEALRDTNAVVSITVAGNGSDALDVLLDRLHGKTSLPDIVLLDLNLPLMDGREFLEKINKHDGLKHIPVVVLTTSHAEQDIRQSCELGANAFINKSVDLDQFLATMKAFAAFWFGAARLWRK